jgi:hypothetical protein
MGSVLSTRWAGHRKATTVEDCLALDVGALERAGAFGQGSCMGSCQWSDPVSREMYFSIAFTSLDDSVHLHYSNNQTAESLDYEVKVETRKLRFGGVRRCFLCPAIGCGQRVRILYLPPGARYFACRRCYRISYASRNRNPRNAALDKAQRIRMRLGGTASMLEPFPPKPEAISWQKYRRLRQQFEEAEQRYDALCWRWVASMDSRRERKHDQFVRQIKRNAREK